MRGAQGKPGWFWLFLIDGLITFVIGLFAMFYLPSSPTRTKSILYPRSWYSEREEVIMINVRRSAYPDLLALTPSSVCSAMTHQRA